MTWVQETAGACQGMVAAQRLRGARVASASRMRGTSMVPNAAGEAVGAGSELHLPTGVSSDATQLGPGH
jgi:hypothetical protein